MADTTVTATTYRKRLFWRLYVPLFATVGCALAIVAVVVRVRAAAAVARDGVAAADQAAVLAAIDSALLLGAGLALGFAVLASGYVPWRLIRLLTRMRRAAERMAEGDQSARLPVASRFRELSGLAQAINTMAGQLERHIHELNAQQQQQRAVLSSMAEGVLAVDTDERLLGLNEAAATLLHIASDWAVGRSMYEVIRHAGIQRFIVHALHRGEPVAEVLALLDGATRYVEAVGTPLRDPAGTLHGAVIVLHDITRLQRIEASQRDFVASVSHELRTPVTSLQGFAETLLDGGLEDKEVAKRFLSIMVQQTSRLHALIEDLLHLSRVEQAAQSGDVPLTPTNLRPLVQSCVTAFAERVDTHDISLDCPESVEACVNERLFEQALHNLLENAVKYSPAGRRVWVHVECFEREIEVRVADEGIGISRENLSRIFNRFYRVEKSRNRKNGGGTGLGLAIVQNIVRAHAGRIAVESELGQGTTFRIILPRMRQPLHAVAEARLASGRLPHRRLQPTE